MNEQPRAEYLVQCKKRALEYLERGDLINAIASMGMDLSRHSETKNYSPSLDALALIYLRDNDVDGVRRWIVGFR